MLAYTPLHHLLLGLRGPDDPTADGTAAPTSS